MKFKILIVSIVFLIFCSKLNAQVRNENSTDSKSSNQSVIIQQAKTEDGIKPKEYETALISNDTVKIESTTTSKPKTLKEIVMNKQKNSTDKKPLIIRPKREYELPKESK